VSVTFAAIEEAALLRHGAAGVAERLVTPRAAAELSGLRDAYFLDQMSLRIFRAGLRHELVDRKWPAFQEVFQGFDPAICARLADEAIEALLEDRRLIRNLPKLRAVRANAAAMLELGGMGPWLAAWPSTDLVGLWAELARRFQQLGGNSAPAFLRMVGKDSFILTDAVVRALNAWDALAGTPRTTGDLAVVQRLFDGWAAETGRPYCQLSQILAMSVDT
jgi:3-methyladenine DNA glycosylase Tag